MASPDAASPGGRTSAAGDGYAELDGMFTVHETIGVGGYAKVKRAEHVLTKDFCALKVVDKTRLSERDLALVMSEVEALSELESKHVVRLYMVVETEARLCLALEFGEGGDLQEHVSSMGQLSEPRSRLILKQVALALNYCHTNGYAHRDLKAENVVFTDAYASIVKLTDFGFSAKDPDDKLLTTMCGSLMYSAPEILLQEPYSGKHADLWSLGVLFYFMVTANLPFDDNSEATAVTKVMDLDYQKPPEGSAECVDLIEKLLVREPKERLALEKVLWHPFLVKEVVGGDDGQLPEPIAPSEAQPKKGSLAKPLAESDPRPSRLSPLKKKATLVPRRPSKIKPSAKRKVLNEMIARGFNAPEVEASIKEHKRDYNSCTFFLLLEQEERDGRNSGRTAGSFRSKHSPGVGGSARAQKQPAAEAADANGSAGGAAAASDEGKGGEPTEGGDGAGGEATKGGAEETLKQQKLRLKKQRASIKQEAKLAKLMEKKQAKEQKEKEKQDAKAKKEEAKRQKTLQKQSKKKKGDSSTSPPADADSPATGSNSPEFMTWQ